MTARQPTPATHGQRTTRRPYQRKKYWNAPTMSWWERVYIIEIMRGLAITGGVFTLPLPVTVTFSPS